MDKLLFLDLETWSETDIKYGSHRYAEGAEILIWSYSVGIDGEDKVYDETSGEPIPRDLFNALVDPDVIIVGHNIVGFDAVVMRANGYDVPHTRLWDTMQAALAHSLPGSLAQLGEVLGIPEELRKLDTGKNLIRLFCIPRPKNHKLRRATRETHPDDWASFCEYARYDTKALKAIYNVIPKWNYKGEELDLAHLDALINHRGVAVDLDLARGAIRATDAAKQRLAEEAYEASEGELEATTQRNKLLELLHANGAFLDDLRTATVEKFLEGDPRARSGELPPIVVELLQNRLQASKSSSAKYSKLIGATNTDGRLRGLLQYCGASRTGRWSGRTFQPQNLPRPSMGHAEIEVGIDSIKQGSEDLLFSNVMELASNALRGVIIAPPGKKLVIADYSNVEGRVLSWLSGEEWKIRAFNDFDAGTGHDLYKLAYAKSFGISPGDVTKDQRQIGKVQELALGYQGGVGAFVTFATAYGIDLEEMGEKAYGNIPEDLIRKSERALSAAKEADRDTYGLSDMAWVVCQSFTYGWRNGHPNVAAWWRELEEAARNAILSPGTPFKARKVAFQYGNKWLRMRLPSGRYLCYPGAKLDDDGKITFMGIDQFTRKWQRQTTYGGKLSENACQAVSRDLLAAALPRLEAASYHTVLTVHDEVIAESPDLPAFNADDMGALMSALPEWASGLPLESAGFECYRYRKE